jgi:RNA-directed DNA polymerase
MKQWRYCRMRIRNLVKLGAVNKEAIFVGISSKGPWKLARTFGTRNGLVRIRRTYPKEQGLVSVKALLVAFHYPNG